jgi:hypothetical protein
MMLVHDEEVGMCKTQNAAEEFELSNCGHTHTHIIIIIIIIIIIFSCFCASTILLLIQDGIFRFCFTLSILAAPCISRLALILASILFLTSNDASLTTRKMTFRPYMLAPVIIWSGTKVDMEPF